MLLREGSLYSLKSGVTVTEGNVGAEAQQPPVYVLGARAGPAAVTVLVPRSPIARYTHGSTFCCRYSTYSPYFLLPCFGLTDSAGQG